MAPRILRFALVLLTGFVALTAIGGGAAMLTGVDSFPPAWLRGTPFPDYAIPALLLAIVVGGSSLAAAVALLAATRIGPALAAFAGLLLSGYIAVEVLILNQIPPGPTPIELLYLGLGLLIVVLALLLQRADRQGAAALGAG